MAEDIVDEKILEPAQAAAESDQEPPLTEEEWAAVSDLMSNAFDMFRRVEEAALKSRLTQNLTISEMHTIAAIGLHEKVPVTEIAHRLKVTLATVTAAVNKLESKGYVVKERSLEDRRQMLVSLTVDGRKAWRGHDMFHKRMVESAMERLSVSDARTLARALTGVRDFYESEVLRLETSFAQSQKR